MIITPPSIWKAAAHGLFRWSAFFATAVAATALLDKQIGLTCLFLIFIIDVATANLIRTHSLLTDELYRRQWHDTLTDRFFYELTFERIRLGEQIYPDSLFKEATKLAEEDIIKYQKDSMISAEIGGLGKTITSVGTYVWQWVSYGTFYGIAWFVGAILRGVL